MFDQISYKNDQRLHSSLALIVTPTHFFMYARQPLWIWYDLFGDQSKKEDISEFTLKLMESGVLHEDEYITEMHVSKVEAIETEEALLVTIELMRQGVGVIYQGCIQVEHEGVIYRGRPDLLERREGKSVFGDWYYVPVEIKWSSKIKTIYKQQLAFYSIILEKLQGYFPEEVGVINRQHNKLVHLLSSEDVDKTRCCIEKIVNVMKGEKPALTITSTSKDSPWFKVALQEAEKSQDIALIYKLDARSLVALRSEGIRTVEDMVAADLNMLPKIPYASGDTLQRAQLQAKALLEGCVIPIGETEELPDTDLKLYFDIEGDPLLEVDYLFGVWVSGDYIGQYATAANVRVYEGGKYFVYFLAKQPEEEEGMWQDFLEWVACLPEEYTVYHYANYEKSHLKLLAEEYGASCALEKFQSRLVDLQKVVEESVIFPLYFYSIKDIAKSKFLNFAWCHQKAGGGQSVFWYKQWLETGNGEVLEDIINYNEDDVRAAERLFMYMAQKEDIKYV